MDAAAVGSCSYGLHITRLPAGELLVQSVDFFVITNDNQLLLANIMI